MQITFLQLYCISLPIFIVLDLLWLGVVARNFYASRLSHLLGDVSWGPAVVFYLIFIFGLTFFATYPGVTGGSLMRTALLGALFGFIAYATYDLTNQATLRDWPISVSIVDMIWGAVLGGTVALSAAYIYELLHTQ